MSELSWNDYFLDIAKVVRTKSKDESLQVGAVLVRPNRSIASTGFNGFSPRIPDKPHLLCAGASQIDREAKLERMIHAEINAVRFCPEHNTDGYQLFVTHHPCADCAKFITTTGITHIHYLFDPVFEERWKDSIAVSRILLEEAKIKVHSYA